MFKAFGNVTLETACSDEPSHVTCTARRALITGSLTTPVALTPNVAPRGVNHPGCLASSDAAPAWDVTYLVWHQAFHNNRNVGDATVVFTNRANGVVVSCEAQGDELNVIGRGDHERWWGCALDAHEAFPQFQIISSVKLNPVTRQFSIKQPWWCNGDGSGLP